ncbi:MAG: hypothetical protein WED04_03320 [Promethearchaeati archaeon SRVP18_Atabeyarchaeia-1]
MVRTPWPRFLRKPKLRLGKPSLRMPQKPSSSTVFGLTLVFLLFVFGGGVWDIVFRSQLLPYGTPSSTSVVYIYPSLDAQFILEGLVASAFIFIGFMGVVIMYQSTRHVYRPNYARLLLISGMVLVLIAYIVAIIMLGAKFTTS